MKLPTFQDITLLRDKSGVTLNTAKKRLVEDAVRAALEEATTVEDLRNILFVIVEELL